MKHALIAVQLPCQIFINLLIIFLHEPCIAIQIRTDVRTDVASESCVIKQLWKRV